MYKVYYIRGQQWQRHGAGGYISQKSFKCAQDCIDFLDKLETKGQNSARASRFGYFISVVQEVEIDINTIREAAFYELG